MKTFLTLFATAALTLSAAAKAETPVASLTEGFDNVATLSGWTLNGSAANSWFQGNSGIFGAYAGAPSSYIGSNFVTGEATGSFDNWLITPEIALAGTTRLTFYTRTAETGYEDTLQVLFGAGSGTATSGFTTSLVSIDSAAYADGWTQYTAEITGTGTGRFAFHYAGSYDTANYIGIDSVAIAAVPEPSTWLMLGLGLAGVGFAARRKHARAAAGAGLALAALGMSSGAMAAQPQPLKEAGLVVVRDAETGQLRAPTAAEYQALVPQAAREQVSSRGVQPASKVVVKSNGTKVLNVADRAVYAVVNRNADGTLNHAEAVGEKAAEAALNNPRTAQAKERSYEAQ